MKNRFLIGTSFLALFTFTQLSAMEKVDRTNETSLSKSNKTVIQEREEYCLPGSFYRYPSFYDAKVRSGEEKIEPLDTTSCEYIGYDRSILQAQSLFDKGVKDSCAESVQESLRRLLSVKSFLEEYRGITNSLLYDRTLLGIGVIHFISFCNTKSSIMIDNNPDLLTLLSKCRASIKDALSHCSLIGSNFMLFQLDIADNSLPRRIDTLDTLEARVRSLIEEEKDIDQKNLTSDFLSELGMKYKRRGSDYEKHSELFLKLALERADSKENMHHLIVPINALFTLFSKKPIKEINVIINGLEGKNKSKKHPAYDMLIGRLYQHLGTNPLKDMSLQQVKSKLDMAKNCFTKLTQRCFSGSYYLATIDFEENKTQEALKNFRSFLSTQKEKQIYGLIQGNVKQDLLNIGLKLKDQNKIEDAIDFFEAWQDSWADLWDRDIDSHLESLYSLNGQKKPTTKNFGFNSLFVPPHEELGKKKASSQWAKYTNSGLPIVEEYETTSDTLSTPVKKQLEEASISARDEEEESSVVYGKETSQGNKKTKPKRAPITNVKSRSRISMADQQLTSTVSSERTPSLTQKKESSQREESRTRFEKGENRSRSRSKISKNDFLTLVNQEVKNNQDLTLSRKGSHTSIHGPSGVATFVTPHGRDSSKVSQHIVDQTLERVRSISRKPEATQRNENFSAFGKEFNQEKSTPHKESKKGKKKKK